MCDFGDESPSVWRSSTHTARKQYQCHECGRTIDAGETYTRDFYVFDGDAGTGFTCSHCLIARSWLIENCGGFSSGLREIMEEHATEYPDIATGLLQVADGMKRRWADGDVLMPIPEMPLSIESVVGVSV